IAEYLPEIGRLVSFVLPSGTGQQGVTSGAHAAALAGQVSNELRAIKAVDLDAPAHLFAACPNSLLFFLGQQYQGIAPVTLYEFDFARKGNRTYHPSFVLD
ncbi:MAG: SAVED domain-containing protein, partial [Reyranella sp.]